MLHVLIPAAAKSYVWRIVNSCMLHCLIPTASESSVWRMVHSFMNHCLIPTVTESQCLAHGTQLHASLPHYNNG